MASVQDCCCTVPTNCSENKARSYGFLQNAKQDGLVAKVGVSIYDPERLAAVMTVCRPDIVQTPLNLLTAASRFWLLQRPHDSGVEVHTRSAFLQGFC